MQPFERVVAEHGPTVLRVCRALLNNDEADDAWSETFLAAFRAYPGLDLGTNLQAWLVTIAHRKAIDILRARSRRPIAVAAVPERPATDTGWQAPDEELRRALGALPDKQRHAVAYHYLADLPHKEIAAILGGSTDAARRAAADGIKTLRAAYPGTRAKGGKP